MSLAQLNSNIVQPSSKSGASRFLLCAVFLGLLASRRWAQLVSPQVWCEDGWLIEGFIKHGWHEFLLPLNGYLVLIPKLITCLSLALSIYYYPIISTALAWGFTAFVGYAVAFAPTRLNGKVLCAISIFASPSDAEVFGLPLYTLWWAAILLLIPALWDERITTVFFRIALVIVGGLSSPYIFIALPVFYFRAFCYRNYRSEKIVAFVATIVACIQVPFVFLDASKAVPSISSVLQNVIPKFCGWFVVGNLSQSSFLLWTAGLVIVALIATYCFCGRRDPSVWILFSLYLGAICSSIARIDPSILHPVLAGPRYFFLPYVLTFWILVQLYHIRETAYLRIPIGIVTVAVLFNAIPVWTRWHNDLQWAENIRSGRLFPMYEFKVAYDGSRNSNFSIMNSGATWNALLRKDCFVSPTYLETLPTFAYRIVGTDDSEQSDNARATLGPVITVTPHDAFLQLRAGNRIRFRSGKVSDCQRMEVVGFSGIFISNLPITTDWVTLEFSNSKLPPKFEVKVIDQGQGVGEWSTSVD
jgi:hypothetical protein